MPAPAKAKVAAPTGELFAWAELSAAVLIAVAARRTAGSTKAATRAIWLAGWLAGGACCCDCSGNCCHKSLRHLLPMTGDDGWLQHDLSAAGGARVTEQQPAMKQPFGLSFLQPHTAQCTRHLGRLVMSLSHKTAKESAKNSAISNNDHLHASATHCALTALKKKKAQQVTRTVHSPAYMLEFQGSQSYYQTKHFFQMCVVTKRTIAHSTCHTASDITLHSSVLV
jgi:hypothetical protein